MKRKLIAGLLSVAMVLTSSPVATFAETLDSLPDSAGEEMQIILPDETEGSDSGQDMFLMDSDNMSGTDDAPPADEIFDEDLSDLEVIPDESIIYDDETIDEDAALLFLLSGDEPDDEGSGEGTGSGEHVHNYVPVVTEPTCSEAGYTTYTCECGDSYIEPGDPATNQHSWDEGVLEGNCETGGTMTFTCTVCGETRSEAVEPSHDWEATVDGAVCTYACINCDLEYSVTMSSGTVSSHGICGENVFYALSNYGDMYIFGCGTMQDYSNVNDRPWNKKTIRSVHFADAVTHVGDMAFNNCIQLQTVDIPRVSSIGANAFYNCSALASISFPEVVSIGDYAFYSCRMLNSISLPEMTSIGNHVFQSCSGLTTVTALNVTSIGNNAFNSCSSLEQVCFGTVSSIENYAFWMCRSLAAIDLKAVTEIRERSFYGCTSLESIASEQIQSIGEYSFCDCSSLISVNLPEATAVGNGSFQNCTSLQNMDFSSAISFGESAFEGCTALQSVSLPVAASIGTRAFLGCTGLESITLPAATTINNYAFSGCTALETINLPSANTIGNYAFKDCSNLTEAVMSAGGVSLAFKSFENCTALKEVSLPDNAELLVQGSTKNGPFYGDSGIALTLLPASGVVPSAQFANGKNGNWFEKVIISDGITTIQGSAFYQYTSLTEVVLPDTLSSIGNYSFTGATGLTKINLESVDEIGDDSFSGCQLLTEIQLKDGASTGVRAFQGCTGLTSADLSGLTTLGDLAFSGCTGLTEVILPLAVNIGNSVFSGCTGVTAVRLPEATTIGYSAFSGCTGITELYIPKVTSIGGNSFYGCSNLETVDLCAGGVTLTGGSFGNCSKLNAVSLPSSAVNNASGSAGPFSNDAVTLTIWLDGSTIPDDFAGNQNGNPKGQGIRKVILPEGITSIGKNAFRNAPDLTEVVIPDSLLTIGQNAFRDDTGLTSINLNSVTTLKSYSFYGCTGLTGADLPEVTSIENNAFQNCTGLTSIVFPKAANIGQHAFYNCSSLQTAVMQAQGVVLDAWAFRNCPALKSVTLPDSAVLNTSGTDSAPFFEDSGIALTITRDTGSIPDYFLQGRGTGIEKIVVSEGITSLGNYSFISMKDLEKVFLPESLTTVGENAFRASSLAEIHIPMNVGSIGYRAFYDCTALSDVYYAGHRSDWERISISGENDPLSAANIHYSELTADCCAQSIILDWPAYTGEESVTYRLSRDGSELAVLEGCTYTDSSITAGESYTYTVRTVSADGMVLRMQSAVGTAATPDIEEIYTDCTPYTVGNTKNEVYVRLNGVSRGASCSLYAVVDGERVQIGQTTTDYTLKELEAVYTFSWDITDFENGSYTVVFVMTDRTGTNWEKTGTVNVNHFVPPAIRNLSALGATNMIALNWSIATEVVTTGYRLYRSEQPDGPFELIAVINGRDTLSYRDENVVTNEKYYYYVTGVTYYGEEGEPSAIKAGVASEDAESPVIISISPADGSRVGPEASVEAIAQDNVSVVEIEWSASTDNTDFDILLTTDLAEAELDLSGYPDGTVYVRAVARDAAGNSSNSMVRTYTLDKTGPAQVTNLRYESSSVIITLHWSNVPDTDLAFFRVEQQVEADGEYVWEMVEDVTDLGINILDRAPDTDYTYRVVAYDNLGNRGSESEPIAVRTQSDNTAPVITAMAPEAGRFNDHINFSVAVEDDYSVAAVVFQTSTDGTTWTDLRTQTFSIDRKAFEVYQWVPLADFGEGYVYVRAIAIDRAGNSSDSSSSAPFTQYIVDRTAPAAPTGVEANILPGQVEIRWLQGSEPDLNRYFVYRSEDGETYERIAANLNKLNYFDERAVPGKTYYYKVNVNDTAGNVSEDSAAVTAELPEDTTEPYIYSYGPEDGSVIGVPTNKFSIIVQDNWRLDSLSVTYTVNDDESVVHTLVNRSGINHNYAKSNAEIDLQELNHGDRLNVSIHVTDITGNETNLPITYTVDVIPPTVSSVTAEPEYDSINVSWIGQDEEDLSGYKVYRYEVDNSRSLVATVAGRQGQTSYSVQDKYAEEGVVYFYRIVAVDFAGNTTETDSNSVALNILAPVLSVPTALSVDTEYYFDASASFAGLGIASYVFDFGDGTPVVSGTESRVIHVYRGLGTFTATLTITNTRGMSASVEKELTVYEDVQEGSVIVHTCNEEGEPLADIPVYFDMEHTSENVRTTDETGSAVFTDMIGVYTIGVYKTGYLPLKKTVMITSGSSTEITFTMINEPIVSGTFEINQMTPEEIQAAGIDISNPANQQMVQVDLNITYGTSSATLTVYTNGTVTYTNKVEMDSRVLIPAVINFAGSSGAEVGGSILEGENIVVAVLDTPLQASFLKEFFDVKLHIFNHAGEEYELTDNVVTLTVPDGLTLMETAVSSPATVTFDSLAGQSEHVVEWILRGDTAGNYDLEALYNAILSQFNAEVSAVFNTKEPVKVFGANAISIEATMEQDEVDKTDVTLSLSMVNTTDTNIYMPEIDMNNIVDVLVASHSRYYYQQFTPCGEYITDSAGNTTSAGNSIDTIPPHGAYVKQYKVSAAFTVTQLEDAFRVMENAAHGLGFTVFHASYDSWSVEDDDSACGDNHTFVYTDNGDGTHTAVCQACGKIVTEQHTDTGDGHCDLCGAVSIPYYTVTIEQGEHTTLVVEDDAGNVITSGESVMSGTQLYVSYSVDAGYVLEAAPRTSYVVRGDLTISTVASGAVYSLILYHENGEAPVVTIDGADDPEHIPYGKNVTITAGAPLEGYSFTGWYETNGKLVTTSETYSFIMMNNVAREARYQRPSGTVTFVSNGQIIRTITDAEEITAEDFPAPGGAWAGFEFQTWDKTVEEINAGLSAGNNVTVNAQFVPIQKDIHVTVYNGNAEVPEITSFTESSIFSVTAEEVEGQTFNYWTVDGVIMSYSKKLSIHVVDSCTLRAVYSAQSVEATGNAQITRTSYNIDTRKLTIVSYLNVPDDCTIKAAGLLAASEAGGYDSGTELTVSNAQYVKTMSSQKHAVQYTWTKKNVLQGDIWYVRAYLVYTDAENNNHEVCGPRITLCAGTEYDPNELGSARITSSGWNETTQKATFVAYLSVPEAGVIQKAGLVAASAETFNPETTILTAENARYVKVMSSQKHAVQYTWTKTAVMPGDTWYARAYLVYTLDGETHTLYGNLVSLTAEAE